MLIKLKQTIKENKGILPAILVFISLIAVFGYIFKDVIEIGLVILFIVAICNIDNISTYFRNTINDNRQKQDEKVVQSQIIYNTIADIFFQGFSGQLGRIIQIIPPQVVRDLYPSNVPSIQEFNGLIKYRFEAHRAPGSPPINENTIEHMVNGYLQKIPTSGLLPPKPGSQRQPYFYTVAVTPDTSLPDTLIFHIIYVDDPLSEAYIENHMRERAENWRRQLIDSQPPDDEDF